MSPGRGSDCYRVLGDRLHHLRVRRPARVHRHPAQAQAEEGARRRQAPQWQWVRLRGRGQSRGRGGGAGRDRGPHAAEWARRGAEEELRPG